MTNTFNDTATDILLALVSLNECSAEESSEVIADIQTALWHLTPDEYKDLAPKIDQLIVKILAD